MSGTSTSASARPDFWGEAAKSHLSRPPLGWLDTEWVVRRRVFPAVFGWDSGSWWTSDAMRVLDVPIGGRWLDLGCGGGNPEIQMARNGLFESMLAYDPSAGAIEVARADAARAGVVNIDFQQADINSLELPEESFDVAHINMALHHVVELEHLIFQVNRALRPGGVFIANEYVGPSQFQFSPERMELVHNSLEALPERLRWNPVEHAVKTHQPRFSRSWWNGYDDTEAIRSEEIESIIAINFPDYRRIDYGGNLLNLILENIAQNFNPERPDDARLIDALFADEDRLLQFEPTDFAYFVCPRGSAMALRHSEAVAAARRGTFVRPHDPLRASDVDAVHQLAAIELEADSGSARRLVGPAIVGAKRLLRRALRFHLAPLVREQTAFNEASVELQRRLLSDLNRELAALRRETTALRRDLHDGGEV
jgi:SAM-dependent methyltransferase